MKQDSLFSRYSLLWIIILCYLVPVLGLIIYGSLSFPGLAKWNMLSAGFLLAAFGTLAFFWMMTQWEKSLNIPAKAPTHPESRNAPIAFGHESPVDYQEYDLVKRSLAEAQQVQIRLLSEIDLLTEEIAKLSMGKTEVLQQSDYFQQELEASKRTSRNQLEQQQTYIRELQERVADQKALAERSQQQVVQLETKVSNLTNEIKTLLHFAEAKASSAPVLESSREKASDIKEPLSAEEAFPQEYARTTQEASLQLKHCLEMAQKIKGSQRFGSQLYSLLDCPADNFSIDLRRLCDRLRGEAQSIILLYSPKDAQLLFATPSIKTLTGWSPEKFTQNFHEILVDESEWKQGVDSLSMHNEANTQLRLKMRSGQQAQAHAVLGIIPTGIFKNHVIAVLY